MILGSEDAKFIVMVYEVTLLCPIEELNSRGRLTLFITYPLMPFSVRAKPFICTLSANYRIFLHLVSRRPQEYCISSQLSKDLFANQFD